MTLDPWCTAVPDWERRLLAGSSLIPELPLFESEAQRALRIFKRLKIPDMLGTPAVGDVTGDWLYEIVAALFGSFDPERHIRMVQEIFLLVPKKNSKTSSAAEIMLTAIILNNRPEAEFLLIAPTKGIADIAFHQIAGSIKLDRALLETFQYQEHIRTITHRLTGAKVIVKAADTDVITGSKSTGILIDETHVFSKKSNAASIFVEIRGALAARPDGFLIQITTQSKDPPSGVFKAELSLARDVRDGLIRLPRLAVLYELPPALSADNGWKDERFWGLVNPNLGRSVRLEFLRNELLAAEHTGREAEALLASQHFNVEIGLSLRSDRWVGADHWEAGGDPEMTLDRILEVCEVVCVGIDGGGLDDLLAIAVLGRETETRRWLLWTHAWAHETVLARRKSEASKLGDLAKEGSLTVVDDMDVAIAGLADRAAEIDEAGLLGMVGLDPMGVGAIVDALAARGIEGDNRVVGVSQGWTLNGAIKTAEIKLANRTLVHCGQALMSWAVGNARAEPKGNAITINKQISGSAKIDPLMATFDAIALMSKNPEATRGRSVYEDRDLMIL